jgi:hypothetical protein
VAENRDQREILVSRTAGQWVTEQIHWTWDKGQPNI